MRAFTTQSQQPQTRTRGHNLISGPAPHALPATVVRVTGLAAKMCNMAVVAASMVRGNAAATENTKGKRMHSLRSSPDGLQCVCMLCCLQATLACAVADAAASAVLCCAVMALQAAVAEVLAAGKRLGLDPALLTQVRGGCIACTHETACAACTHGAGPDQHVLV